MAGPDDDAAKKLAEAVANSAKEDLEWQTKQIQNLGREILALAERTKMEQEVKSRGIITWTATGVYCFVIIFVAALLGTVMLRTTDATVEDKLVVAAMDLLKVGVLPILTLVIGYYLGQKSPQPTQTPTDAGSSSGR